jgi:hypothetical protein
VPESGRDPLRPEFLRNFRLATLFEFKAGNYTITNLTDGFRQANPIIGRNIPRAAEVEAIVENPASTPEQRLEAAKIWAYELKALSPYDGLNQNGNGDFLRWRELSLTYTAGAGLASRFGARDLTFTIAARNLKLWSRYNGVDPEINAIGRGGQGEVDAQDQIDDIFLDAVDAFGLPLPRRFTFSVRLGF